MHIHKNKHKYFNNPDLAVLFFTDNVVILSLDVVHLYSRPSLSVDSTSMDSINQGLKILGTKMLHVAGMCYEVMPMMIIPNLNMYGLFFCPYSLNNTG